MRLLITSILILLTVSLFAQNTDPSRYKYRTITEMMRRRAAAPAGADNKAWVSDTLKGGQFTYKYKGGVALDSIVYLPSAITDSMWQRDLSQSPYILAKWVGVSSLNDSTTNTALVQKLINYGYHNIRLPENIAFRIGDLYNVDHNTFAADMTGLVYRKTELYGIANRQAGMRRWVLEEGRWYQLTGGYLNSNWQPDQFINRDSFGLVQSHLPDSLVTLYTSQQVHGKKGFDSTITTKDSVVAQNGMFSQNVQAVSLIAKKNIAVGAYSVVTKISGDTASISGESSGGADYPITNFGQDASRFTGNSSFWSFDRDRKVSPFSARLYIKSANGQQTYNAGMFFTSTGGTPRMLQLTDSIVQTSSNGHDILALNRKLTSQGTGRNSYLTFYRNDNTIIGRFDSSGNYRSDSARFIKLNLQPKGGFTSANKKAVYWDVASQQLYQTDTSAGSGSGSTNYGITYVTVTTATYTVPDVPGNKTVVLVNYAGTAAITLPAAASNTNKEVTIKTITANGVSIVGGFISDANAIGASSYGAYTYFSDGSTWYMTSRN